MKIIKRNFNLEIFAFVISPTRKNTPDFPAKLTRNVFLERYRKTDPGIVR